MRHRNKVISIRASDVEYNVIKNLAGDAKETVTDYIIKCAMQKKIIDNRSEKNRRQHKQAYTACEYG